MGSYVHKYLITLYVARPTKDTTSARPYSPACAGFGHDSGREEGIAARLGLAWLLSLISISISIVQTVNIICGV